MLRTDKQPRLRLDGVLVGDAAAVLGLSPLFSRLLGWLAGSTDGRVRTAQ